MKNGIALWALLLIGCASTPKGSEPTVNEKKMDFIEKQLASIGQIAELHKKIKDIDISVGNLYPIAVVDDTSYFIFDVDQSGENYEFKMEYPLDMDMPDGVLASFPLEFYDMKASAIISPKAFETIEGQIALFHEFVHCFQFHGCEMKLRQTLNIVREAMAKQDYMWELNHPFPYDSDSFIKRTMELDNSYDIGEYHKELNSELKGNDFEYMIWQEWKEGYARYIENLIRERLGVHKNSTILTPPFDRVFFYEIGSRYIETMIKNDTGLKGNLEALFYKMMNGET